MPWLRLGRDALALALAIALWRVAHGAAAASGDTLATAGAAGAGAVLALVAGALGHEWGHLAGALAGRGRVELRRGLGSIALFRFRTDCNDRARFLWMAFGGLAGVWSPAVVLPAALPLAAASGRVAVGVAVTGALFTTAVEGPIVWRVLRGGPLPPTPGS